MGTSEAETSVRGKAESLLAIGEAQKCKLFGVTVSFKYHKRSVESFSSLWGRAQKKLYLKTYFNFVQSVEIRAEKGRVTFKRPDRDDRCPLLSGA